MLCSLEPEQSVAIRERGIARPRMIPCSPSVPFVSQLPHFFACLGMSGTRRTPDHSIIGTGASQGLCAHARYGVGSGIPQFLTVVDGVTNQKGTRIPLGLSSGLYTSLALAPDGLRAYVTNERDTTVSVVSTVTNTVIETLPKALFLGPGVLQDSFTTSPLAPIASGSTLSRGLVSA